MPQENTGDEGQGVQLLSKEEAEQLFTGGQIQQDGPQVQTVPVTIYTTRGEFVVEDFNSWALTPHGAFATGKFAESEDETDVLFPFTSIVYIEYDFGALEELYKQQQAGQSSDESEAPAEGEANGSQDGESPSS